MMKTLIGVLALALAGLAAGSALAGEIVPAAQQVWARYVNDRFGVSAEVPALGFVAQRPPENGDGQGWISPPDVEIAVFGNYWSVLTENFAEYRSMQRGFLTDAGARITYEPKKGNWYVFSGYLPDGRIFYDRTLIAPGCSISANLHLVYPESYRQPMDEITTHISKSLAIDVSACDG